MGPKSEWQCFADCLKKVWTIDIRGIWGPPGMKGVDHFESFGNVDRQRHRT